MSERDQQRFEPKRDQMAVAILLTPFAAVATASSDNAVFFDNLGSFLPQSFVSVNLAQLVASMVIALTIALLVVWLIICRSAIDLRQAEASFQHSKEQLRLALQAADVGLWDWDIATDQVQWSDNIERLFGLPPGTFDGTHRGFMKCVYPPDRQRVMQFIEAALTTGNEHKQEFRVLWADGSIHWISETSQLIFDRADRPIRMVGTSIDITERKQVELALQQLNAELEDEVQIRIAQLQQVSNFEAMLKRITDKVRDSLDEEQILQTAVAELGMGLGVHSCNAALYDLDYQTSTICYEYNLTLFPFKGRVADMTTYPEIYQPLLQGQYLQFCNTIVNPIRGRVTMLACPIIDGQSVLGDLWLINDKEYAFRELELRLVQQVANQCAIAIRQARLYQKAQAQVKALEELNRLKDDFLSTVSHELRTPVTNMKLAIQMLETVLACRTATSAHQKALKYVKILDQECEREISLVNDLLDLQRLEAGKRSPLREIIQLQDWLPQVIKPFIERAADRQQQLSLELPIDLPPIVSDLSSLERIVSELLNNACKYTPPGEHIWVRVDSQIQKLQFSVTNWGAEIAPEEIPRIFDKFYRVPSGDPWKQGGTGLGLALVMRLVEILDGKLEVKSGDRQTQFTIEIPNLAIDSQPGTVLTRIV